VTNDGEALACTCARVADERKAEQIVVLHVEPLTFVTGYFVIVTGLNERQIGAIVSQVRGRAEQIGHKAIGVEGAPDSGWVLIDLGDVVVHVFSPEARRLYDLELLWGEAQHVAWQQVPPLAAPGARGDGAREQGSSGG
jgi:ribosome-associated protein